MSEYDKATKGAEDEAKDTPKGGKDVKEHSQHQSFAQQDLVPDPFIDLDTDGQPENDMGLDEVQVLSAISLTAAYSCRPNDQEPIMLLLKLPEEEFAPEMDKVTVLILRDLEIAMTDIKENISNDKLAKAVLNKCLLSIVFRAAFSMRYDNHNTCLPVLTALTDNMDTIQLMDGGFELVQPLLSQALIFLYSVTPQWGHSRHESVWKSVDANLKKLVQMNMLEPVQLPYYSVHLPSPVFTWLLTYHDQLNTEFASWKKTNPNKANAPFLSPVQEIVDWELNSALGDHTNDVDSDTAQANSEKRLDICSKLVTQGLRGLSVHVLGELHATMDLAEDVVPGEFRKEPIVGSWKFFSSYRVFLPPEEVGSAMEHVVDVVNTAGLHPAVLSYYIFSAMVHWIHPYEDGNGRMSRVLANLVLKCASLPLTAITFRDKVLTFQDFLNRL